MKVLRILAFVALATAAQSQTILLNSVATTVGHSFDVPAHSTLDWIYGAFWGATPATPFTASLSSNDTFRLTVAAPAGSAFVVDSKPGSIGGVLAFGSPLSDWIAPGWNGGLRYSLPTTVSFSDFQGQSWYSDTSSISVDTDGRALIMEGALWWSGAAAFSFRAVTIEADLSSLSGLGFPFITFSPDLAVGIRYQDVLAAGTFLDPGPALRVTAVAVPEASALPYSGVALLVLLAFKKRLTRR